MRDVIGHTDNRPKDLQSAASTVVTDNILDCNYEKSNKFKVQLCL